MAASYTTIQTSEGDFETHEFLMMIAKRCVVYYDQEEAPPSIAFGDSEDEATSLLLKTYGRSAYYGAHIEEENVQMYCNTR